MTKVTVEVEEGSRAWAMAKHDEGEKVDALYNGRKWVLVHGRLTEWHEGTKFRLHVKPPQPIILQPGTPEYRKYLATDEIVSCLSQQLVYRKSEWDGLIPFEAQPSVVQARVALAAYRGEGETK